MGLLSRAKELGSSTSALMRGVADYRKTGTTPTRAYHLMRQYYCRTHGYSNELLSMFVKAGSAARAPAQSAGVLGNLTAEDVERVKAELDISGYYRFPTRIPEAACDRLVDFALTTPCAPVPRAAEMPERLLYQRDQPEAIAYHFDEQELFENQDVQALATDPSIIAVANAYLGSQPVLDLAAMWWSTSFGRTASSEVAQLFHFDMDRLKFLKFFIYLTDVTPENGPHVYVAKSHTRGGKPDTLWRDARR